MKFEKSFVEAQFIKRYKRFFADIDLKGKIEVAHVANTGSLKGVLSPGQRCYVTQHDDPSRKLKFSLEALQDPISLAWVGVNTSLPNKSMKEIFSAVQEKRESLFDLAKILQDVPHWQEIVETKAEHAISKETRLDFRLKLKSQFATDKFHFVEIKNVTMRTVQNKDSHAQFPDSVTERGQKHLRELMQLVDQGHSCEIIFFIQRSDVNFFSPAQEIDPAYADLLIEASRRGVRITPLVFEVTAEKIEYLKKIDFLN